MLLETQQKLLSFIYDNDVSVANFLPYQNDEAIMRLNIYKHNVLENLHQTLINSYPILYHNIGRNAFKILAYDYIKINRPNSGNLDDYGHNLSNFLKTYHHTKNHLYLVDLAKLENIKEVMLNAPDYPKMSLDLLKNIAPAQYLKLEFVFNSNFKLLKSKYNILDVYLHDKDFCKKLSYIMIYRDDFEVIFSEITSAKHSFLLALKRKLSLNAAYDLATKYDNEFDLGIALQELFRKNLIINFNLSDS